MIDTKLASGATFLKNDTMTGDTTNAHEIAAYRLACTPMAFMSPYYQHVSAWHEHLPFALWLVENLRPRTVVELGAHYGVSYFAFCQAVKQLGLDTHCYAIDTWQGDPHAGKYDETVYSTVASYNNEHYSAFSRLIRSLFDKALPHFKDGGIDLLHIDGHHSYESVKHDFESWLPKMSERSIVIFHDTNVREKGFGVFRLFEEIRSRYPHFEFVHGHGLGIVGTGAECSPQMKELFQLQQIPASRMAFMNIFARLGQTCANAFKLKEQSTEIVKLKEEAIEETARFDTHLSELSFKIDRSTEELVTLRTGIEATKNENASLSQQLFSETEKIVRLENQAREYAADIAIRFDEIAILTKIIRELEKLPPEIIALRQAAIDEIGKIVTAFAPTGQQRSLFGKLRINQYGHILDKADFFDADWYLKKYPDVANAGVNASRHYLEYGVREGRLPNSKFDK